MRANDGRVVSSFIVQALNGEPLTVYGSGAQTRSFCYVDDLADGLLAMLDGDEAGPINLGNPREQTIADLATVVRSITGSGASIEYHPLPQDDPVRRRPDIHRASDRLRWRPQVGIEEGLRRTAEWFATRPEEIATALQELRDGQLRTAGLIASGR
jgi:dTDP-glucose 4,6-dehydratase